MKKLICAMLCCLFLLGGCGTDEPEKDPTFPATVTTQTLLDSGAFSEQLEELELDIAVMLFWLEGEAADYEGSRVYYSTGATSEVAAVIALRDAGQAQAVETALNNWVESQIEAERNYRPAEVEKLEHAIVEARGNSVLLVVAADWETAKAAIAEQ